MAHISDAYGTITLNGAWTAEMLEALNTVKQAWMHWTYYITVEDDFTAGGMILPFNGGGRWAFHANIENLDRWIRDDFCKTPGLEPAYRLLTAEMERSGASISFAYSDCEAGSQFICDGSAVFKAKGGELIRESFSETDVEYCWREYLAREYGGEDSMAELIDEVFDRLEVEESRQKSAWKAVEAWLIENTLPYVSGDCLNAEELEQLRAIIEAAIEA